MKKTITLLFLVLSMSVASAQDTLTPAQMREDFNYMMERYERVHPNPTWSLGEERYNELKQQTLARLDHPMTQIDFWRIIARWNQHFDGHTHVGFPPSAPRMPEGMMVFPPYSIVQYRDGKLRFSSYDGMPDSLQGCAITSIDGHPATEIVDSILPYISHESPTYLRTIILRSLYVYYNLFYGYSPQMTFAYRTTGGERSVVLDRRILYEWLVQVGDKGNIGGTGPRDIPWHFSIFPEQGIALFEFNTCGPNDKFEQFDSVVAACIDSVNQYGIKHLFVDISHNSGGNDAFCKRFLCHLDGLTDKVAAMDMTDTEMGSVAGPEERRVTMTFTPKSPSYGGKLYFIQSQFTYSAAILLANMAKQYRLGTVIGEETGGLTTTFTRHNPIMLPNSGLTFYCSDKQFRHIGTTGAHGVLPDILLEIGYKYLFRSFTAEELLQMIETIQSEQRKAYLDICGQFRTDMTPCEKMELYVRMDSLFDGNMPDYNNLYNYMITSFLCGDTMTFKKQLVRATDWKCWNSKLIDTWDAVEFLKKEKDWNQLDSLSKIYGIKKIYPYMDSLEAMVERDQAIRSELHNPNLSIEQKDSIFTQWQIIDSTNLTLLKSLINRYGFPTWERVGYTGCRNAWLIAQHAIPYIYDFEKEYHKAVMDNNATKNLLAYLEDRSRTMRGLPQLYGTQLATNPKDYLPISDIKNVNSRREEIGLEPLNDYLKRMSIDINDYFILQDTSEPNYIDFYYKGNKLEPWGVIKAQGYLDENELDKASVLYCHVFHNTYPFIRDLKRFVSTLIMNGGKSDQYLFISTYEVLERMVLCGYEPDAWLDSLPDTLTVPLRADYANLRDEYLRYLNHEDDAVLTAALANRADFEALLRSGKNYYRYELDAWNHAYPLLQKMTDELTKGDYEEFYALLWREVERGNLHAEDYATLYDHTYYRLYGKDWYGTVAASDKHIRTAKPKTLNDRRRAACLPSAK